MFKGDGIEGLDGSRYIKRVGGEPGEHVELSDGQLFINGELTVLSNELGGIVYKNPQFPSWYKPRLPPMQTDLTVPNSSYYVLGDCATNSFDSRFFGSIPRQNITGRICFCFWPPGRIGFVK